MTTRPPYGLTVPGNDWSVLDGLQPEVAPMVSVIVVHFEQHDDLARTLAALDAQTHPADRIEIIVVDDGSVIAPRVPESVRLIVQEDLGFRASAARNAGAAAASGSVLCFLDADMTPEPGYVAAMVRLPALAPEAVTVGHRKHAELGTGSARELPEPAWLVDAYASSRDLLDSDERSYRYLIGAVLACSRWFFDEVGGFDEGFTSYGGEDWEWAHRAWLAGAIFAHVRDAVAWHNGPDAAVRDVADGDEALQKKNRETLALLPLIAVPGATGRGIAAAATDVVVRVAAGDPAALYQCVDLLLQALPTARIVIDPVFRQLFRHDSRVAYEFDGRYRTLVEVSQPFRIRRADASAFAQALADACTRVGRGSLGTVVLGNTVELVITSSRAESRAGRWPDSEPWSSERVPFDLSPIDPGHGLAAYLGGWGE